MAPLSALRQTGCPPSTAATSELVVPRSMPTARTRHLALTLDSPGSEMSNSASTGMARLRRRFLVHRHLVEEAVVVAHRHQIAGDGLEVGRLLREHRADRAQGRLAPP